LVMKRNEACGLHRFSPLLVLAERDFKAAL